MLSFFWTGFSSFALVSLIAQANVDSPSARESPPASSFQPLEPVNPNFDEPFCYFQASNGRVIDLTSLCGQTSTLPLFSYPSPPQVYDAGAISTFDDAVYGEGN
jgi:hypothetical protein